jgi:hypothetical protein
MCANNIPHLILALWVCVGSNYTRPAGLCIHPILTIFKCLWGLLTVLGNGRHAHDPAGSAVHVVVETFQIHWSAGRLDVAHDEQIPVPVG